MSVERDSDADLLASISDGGPVDWNAAGRGADGGRLARLGSLRDLARIADFHRELQRGGDPGAMPERWGDLMLLERLGAGTHAEVFRAWDPGLQREVALKLLRADAEDASLLEEGRAAARIRHPNVVTVHGIDRREGRVGLRMELVRGVTLEQQVRSQGPLEPAEARRLGLQLGAALAAVHAAGLLHRDLKPANVVRDPEGRFVLADFGLGRRRDRADAGRGPSGTPMYMAPELLAGAPASERSDLYSLGMLMWFALTGRHPFDAGTFAELADLAKHGPRPGLRERRPGLPTPLARVVERAIAPDPDGRFGSAREFETALEAWHPAGAANGRRRWLLAAGIAVVIVAAIVIGSRLPRHAAAPPPAPAPAVEPTYAVEASFLRRDVGAATRLASGDRVKPGDRLSLEVRVTRPAWVYVLNEDEHGERYLLFPQLRFDAKNPIPAESTFVLPGTMGGKESAWRVTSAGGREYFLVVASPEPVPEIESELDQLPAPEPGRPVQYARVSDGAVERLRGVGGVETLPQGSAPAVDHSATFERFRALAGRESGVHGVWVRQIVLENPGR